ncbi:hypothetical protein ACE6H2_023792 [Prunus campanulata]
MNVQSVVAEGSCDNGLSDYMIFLMDKPNFPEKQTPSWGTWDELLLACAVHRFGTQSWDAVATELRKRSSNLHLLNPQACKRKFHELRRRFSHNDAASDKDDDTPPIPWLDQLRQRRLDELRRELQRYDHSVVSLQLKVERLKEVREQSLRETEKPVEKSDLEKTGEEEIEHKDAEPEDNSPERKGISGEVSEHDDRSCNESNTTDPKHEIPETEVDDADKGSGQAEPAGEEVEPVEKLDNPVVEDSCNGSSDSVMKEPAVVEAEKGNSDELKESVAESKGREEEEGTEESPSNSEVQSSASLPRKLGQEPKSGGPGGPERPEEPSEPDQEDESPAMKGVPVESQPLVEFLGILRSHKFASFFERRLHSQEAPIYKNMIRQHVDFELVQTRLEGGRYEPCSRFLFFRDLLLICNNAMVFFEKKSPEYKAACELQLLVSKEMVLQAPKQDPPPKEETPKPPAPPSNQDPETSDSLLAKSKLSLPLNACRKRSSITARASTSSSSGPDRKKEQITPSFRDVKPAISWKQKEESSDEVEKLHVTKKRRKERLRSSSRNNSSKNGRSRGNTNDRNSEAIDGFSSRVVTSNENSESKAETEKKSNTNASVKKRSAADFLSRMKRSSTSKTGLSAETSKTPDNNSKGGRAEQRKNGNGKGNAQKDQGSRRGSGGRQAAKEQGSPTKRSVGRPSKRAAAPATAGPAKRTRQRG